MSRKALFLDRDGTINVAPPAGGYVLRWDDFAFHDAAFDWVRLANALGMLAIVVTNQRCVARGLVVRAVVDDIHVRMAAEFARRGCRIDDVYVCPHGDGECDCRKPLPGMVLAAQAKWGIDLAGSLMIGDSDRDRGLAAACGLTFLRAEGGRLV